MQSSQNINREVFSPPEFRTKRTPGYIVYTQEVNFQSRRRRMRARWSLQTEPFTGSWLFCSKTMNGRHDKTAPCPKNWFMA